MRSYHSVADAHAGCRHGVRPGPRAASAHLCSFSLDAPADKKCVEYKNVEITTQCGTENKYWTDPWGAQVCADAPKYCKETITDCARWE